MTAHAHATNSFRSARMAFLILTLSTLGCATTREPMLTQGFVAPGYEDVRDEFERNLRERKELGGAFAAYVNGEKVVDVWGGHRRPQRDFACKEDTTVVVFSATKGVAAMALAHLHSRGLLDSAEEVATYWPEFAAKGKGEVTVRPLLSHQAGIVLLSREPNLKDIEDVAALLADAEPLWTPGDYQGYHAGTIGLAMQVLVHRIDPKHRSLNQYLQEEIAGPLGADFSIGLPEDYDRTRLATLKPFSPFEALFHLGEIPKGLRKVLFNRKSLFWRSMGSGKVDVNAPAFTDGENASGNGVGTARGLARLYGELAAGAPTLGLTPETLEALFGPPEEPRVSKLDKVMNLVTHFGLGFQKPNPDDGWFSPSPRAIGFLGASGAIGFADPDLKIGAAYVTNRMSPGTQVNDPRERALHEALYRCVKQAQAR